jgi:hypothetical protein
LRVVRKYAKGFTAADGFDIRSINAGKKLTRYKREKLQRYYQVIREGLARPHVVMRPRNKQRLLSVQKASGHQDFPKDLKVAFYPSMSDVKPKFNKKNEFLYATNSEGLQRFEIPIDPIAYIQDPDAEIQRIMDATPAQFFEIRAGENHLKQSYNRRDLANGVARLTARYVAVDFEPDTDYDELADEFADELARDAGMWGHWLTGVTAYYSPNWEAYANERKARARVRNLKDDLKSEMKRKPKSLNKKAEHLKNKLALIQRINAVHLERGLPLIDPEEYGIDPNKF